MITQKKFKKNTKNRYTAKQWAAARADYETGNFTVAQISKMHGMHTRTIDGRLSKENWIKGKNRPIIEKSISDKNIALFANLGMPQEKVAKKIVEGIYCDEISLEKLAEYIAIHHPKNKDEENGPKNDYTDFDKHVINLVKNFVGDKYLSLRYIQELNKMCGSYAPLKKDITSDGNQIVNPVKIYLPDNGRN